MHGRLRRSVRAETVLPSLPVWCSWAVQICMNTTSGTPSSFSCFSSCTYSGTSLDTTAPTSSFVAFAVLTSVMGPAHSLSAQDSTGLQGLKYRLVHQDVADIFMRNAAIQAHMWTKCAGTVKWDAGRAGQRAQHSELLPSKRIGQYWIRTNSLSAEQTALPILS